MIARHSEGFFRGAFCIYVNIFTKKLEKHKMLWYNIYNNTIRGAMKL